MKRIQAILLSSIVVLAVVSPLEAMEIVSNKKISIALRDNEIVEIPDGEWNILREMISYKDMINFNDDRVTLPCLGKEGLAVLRKYLSIISAEDIPLRELLLSLLKDESSQEFHEMMVAADYLGLDSLIDTFTWFFDAYFVFTFPPQFGSSISEADRAILRRFLALPLRLRAVSKEAIERTFLSAAEQGDKGTLVLLLQDGCVDINCRDIVKQTALMKVIKHGKSKELAEFLLEEGADVARKDINGMNALMLAAESSDGIERVTRVFRCGAGKVGVNEASSTGCTALMSAARNNNVNVVNFLLAQGAVVTQCDMIHMNALIIACASSKDCAEVVEILLKHDAVPKLEVNVTVKGRNALTCAAANGREKIVALLLHAGALEGLNKALRLAREKNHEGVVQLLIGAGALVEDEYPNPDDLASLANLF